MNYRAPEVTVGSERAVEHTLGGCIRRPVTADSSLLCAARSLPLCLLISPEAKPFPYSSRSCTHQAVELGASLSCDSRPVRITPQTGGTERMGVIFTSQAGREVSCSRKEEARHLSGAISWVLKCFLGQLLMWGFPLGTNGCHYFHH